MQIKNIFKKDIFRPINGVIKVNQDDAAVIWQELDEYVVTRELDGHFRKFFGSYLDSIQNSNNKDISNRVGVWVSGFFGSGKSHFIKIISYLLENRAVTNPETNEERRAIDFFQDKFADEMFYGDLINVTNNPTDVLLFNIDSKAGTADGRDAILRVFMRVLNELQGFSSQHLHLAELELQLQKEGNYEKFQAAFERIYGSDWKTERSKYRFRREATVKALAEASGMNEDAAEKLLEQTRTDYNLTIENFARRVKEYLDSKGKDQRIVFVADEVGQFIGTDVHLMLSLQTIVENLGTICEGKAWVVVTSQENMDSILGNVVGARSNDFSKIQGRFPTRLSLSSSNTNEVIQARLLEKTDEADVELKTLYGEKGDVLRNQLSFSDNKATLKNYRGEEDFSKDYPFAPYHYQLVQAVFESIRKAGATGLHLARGERSMLDAFQSSAKGIAQNEIGKLIPFYEFYPSVESFLDTAVKRTIDQSLENESLEEFDNKILRLLFLIRYVEIINPNIDNLVTLCITKVDDDRIELKKNIEASLGRLEGQTLISRNGDTYYFLTNEERDIGREIKNLDISADSVNRQMAKVLFEDILQDAASFRYPVNKKDFKFNRLADGVAFQGNLEHNLNLEIVTPLNDEYDSFTQQRCILNSDGRILLKLNDNKNLRGEIHTFLKTENYVRQKNDAAAPPNTRRILSDKAGENQQRGQRIVEILEGLLTEAEIYTAGQKLSDEKKTSVADAQNYLVKNLFTKLGYLHATANDPTSEVRAVLIADDMGQQNLIEGDEPNANALEEIRKYINLRTKNNLSLTLEEVTQQFERQPYGWRDWDTVLLTAKLFSAGELTAKIEGGSVSPKDAVETFTKAGLWKKVGLLKRQTTGTAELTQARKTAHEIFGKLSDTTGEDKLYEFIRKQLNEWREHLRNYQAQADSGTYPGKAEIKGSLQTINELLQISDSFKFFETFNGKKNDLLDLGDDFAQLKDFYGNQINIWKKLIGKLKTYQDNRSQLVQDSAAKEALARLELILQASSPYSMIHEIEPQINIVEKANEQILEERRQQAISAVEQKIEQIKSELDKINADSDTKHATLLPFQGIKKNIETEDSIQKISYQQNEYAEEIFHETLQSLETKQKQTNPGEPAKEVRQTKVIKPAELYKKLYIESESDADEFVKNLRDKLQEMLDDNVKIRIK